MRDFSSWSLNLGRWHGIAIRLHAYFLLLAVLTLYLSMRNPAQDYLPYGLMFLGVLLVSVLAHEVGHCVAAFRMGGSTDQIVLWPLGGLAQPQVPHEYQHELMVAIAGPLVNLAIFLLTAPMLWAFEQNVFGLLSPFSPHELFIGSPWLVLLKLTFWINWLLVLANLIPAFPLDGGRVLRSVLWRWLDYRSSVLVVTGGAKFIALCLIVIACAKWDEPATSLLPAWVALLLIAMFLFFSAKQEMARIEEQDLDDEFMSYDFSQGYTSLERHFDGPRRQVVSPLKRWIDNRREERSRKQRLLEQEEERGVDEVLVRLHEIGLEGLSAHERALLERVSARYRNRSNS